MQGNGKGTFRRVFPDGKDPPAQAGTGEEVATKKTLVVVEHSPRDHEGVGSHPAWGCAFFFFLFYLSFTINHSVLGPSTRRISMNDAKITKIPSWAARVKTGLISSDWCLIILLYF